MVYSLSYEKNSCLGMKERNQIQEVFCKKTGLTWSSVEQCLTWRARKRNFSIVLEQRGQEEAQNPLGISMLYILGSMERSFHWCGHWIISTSADAVGNREVHLPEILFCLKEKGRNADFKRLF